MADESDPMHLRAALNRQLGRFDQSRLAHTQTRITYVDGRQVVEDNEVLARSVNHSAEESMENDKPQAINGSLQPETTENVATSGAQSTTVGSTTGTVTSSFTRFTTYRLVSSLPMFPMNMFEDLQIGRVYDWLLVSSEDVANNLELMRTNKVRRIINLASMFDNKFPNDFEYMRVEINDVPTARISDYFASSYDFIEEARRSDQVCLVHCNAGISRSCSIVIAYVMRYEKLTFQDALQKVQSVRSVCSPNYGFRGQLRQLETQLQSQIADYPANSAPPPTRVDVA